MHIRSRDTDILFVRGRRRSSSTEGCWKQDDWL